jgi:hypothetical protein
MKKINSFNKYCVSENFLDKLGKKIMPYTLPSSSTNREADENIFFFSTEKKDKSLVINLFLDKIEKSVTEGKILKGKEINSTDFWATYKSGSDKIKYTYAFWTENNDLVQKTKNSILKYQGQEWEMICEFPSNIIEELYVTSKEEEKRWGSDEAFRKELIEKAKSKIIESSVWKLRNGIGSGPDDGWQLAGLKSQAEYDAKRKSEIESEPKWIKKIKSIFR